MQALIREIKKMIEPNPYNIGYITGSNIRCLEIIKMLKKHSKTKKDS